jgi:hypothetical protein
LDLKLIKKLVYSTREKALPGWMQTIFTEPFRWIGENDQRSFTRFNLQAMIGKEGVVHSWLDSPILTFSLNWVKRSHTVSWIANF